MMCPDELCNPYLNGQLLYFDRSHLSFEGAVSFGNAVLEKKGIPNAFN